jgi:hypothetical protein
LLTIVLRSAASAAIGAVVVNKDVVNVAPQQQSKLLVQKSKEQDADTRFIDNKVLAFTCLNRR